MPRDLVSLHNDLTAFVRQYHRATDAGDLHALGLEENAIGECLRRLAYEHLEHRLGLSSSEWFWLDGVATTVITLLNKGEISVTGSILCSAADGRARWAEPYQAALLTSNRWMTLAAYTIWLGISRSQSDVPEFGERLCSETNQAPPVAGDEWAFVFRMDDLLPPA